MSKLTEIVVSALVGPLLGVAASAAFGQSGVWPPLLWTAGILVLYVAGKSIYWRTPMGKASRLRRKRMNEANTREVPAHSSQAGVVVEDVGIANVFTNRISGYGTGIRATRTDEFNAGDNDITGNA